jgi:hypothetical protein
MWWALEDGRTARYMGRVDTNTGVDVNVGMFTIEVGQYILWR